MLYLWDDYICYTYLWRMITWIAAGSIGSESTFSIMDGDNTRTLKDFW